MYREYILCIRYVNVHFHIEVYASLHMLTDKVWAEKGTEFPKR